MWTIDYVKEHPFGGGFEAYRQNQIRYDIVAVKGQGASTTVKRDLTVDKSRAYHSSYFEMLGEQGFPETASLAELAAKARGVVVTLDEPVIRQRVATVRETLSHLGE